MTTIFANVGRTATSTIRFIYQERFPSGIGPLYGIIWHYLSLGPDDYSCKNTFSFVSQIKNVNYSGKFLVSYDVTSVLLIIYFKKLFT